MDDEAGRVPGGGPHLDPADVPAEEGRAGVAGRVGSLTPPVGALVGIAVERVPLAPAVGVLGPHLEGGRRARAPREGDQLRTPLDLEREGGAGGRAPSGTAISVSWTLGSAAARGASKMPENTRVETSPMTVSRAVGRRWGVAEAMPCCSARSRPRCVGAGSAGVGACRNGPLGPWLRDCARGDTAAMRHRSSHRLDRAALASIVGNSLMAVVASAHGYDEPQPSVPVSDHREAVAA